MKRKSAGVALVLVMILTICFCVSGCKSGGEESSSESIELTYWVDMGATTASVLSTYNDSAMYQKMEELTGIKLDFRHPPAGQGSEQFNLMIASRDLPDFLEYSWGKSYPGGAEKAISDNMIISLNDLVKENCPNLQKLLDENETISKQSMTDNKMLYAFPAIGEDSIKTTGGPLIRKDWLDQLGVPMPETIDDWDTMLTQFHDKIGATVPLTGLIGNFTDNNFLSGAFNVGTRFYLKDGTVKYGPCEPEYKEYVMTLKDWYSRGLLDSDFLANDGKAVDNLLTTGQSGALYGYIGSALGKYLNTMKDKDPDFNLVGAQYPVKNRGDKPKFAQRAWEVRSDGMLAITVKNKYPEESAKWADYFYSDEGNLLKNFGIEGETYTMVDGYPKYTDLIMKNPDGLSIGQAISKYTRAATPSPGLIDRRYHEQYYDVQQQKDAMNLWDSIADYALETTMPQVTPTVDEAEELSVITSSVNSYVDEMFVRFVLGTEPMENYDTFLSQIKGMRIERAVEIYQAALKRYKNR